MCEVYRHYSLRWYKVGSNDGGLNAKILRTETINSITFVIPNVTEHDDGIYVCEVRRFIVGYVANATIAVKSQGTVFIRQTLIFFNVPL